MKGEEEVELLAKRASEGDEESFVLLCGVMKTRLYRTAKGILGDEALALDAVSEAVCRAYKAIGRLRQPEYVTKWFTRIVLNSANDLYRRHKREVSMDRLPNDALANSFSH